jgi:ribosomal protein S12 methylthiotransferase accessory factor
MQKIMEAYFPHNLQVAADIGGHTIIADQSTYAGGDGKGPAPFGFFLYSIVSCGAFYALAFCKQRDIDTTGMRVELLANQDPITKLFTAFHLKLITSDGFPEKYESAIIRSMAQCAVAQHLESGAKVTASTDLSEKK